MPGVVVDTHAIVWHLSQDSRLSRVAHDAITAATNDGKIVCLPWICLVELTYLVEKGRLPRQRQFPQWHNAQDMRGDFGEVAIETPRDRNGEFQPKIVAKRQTSVGNFTEIIISLYARGMSTREIEDHVRQIYGVEVSPQFVSRATEQLQQQITDWQGRPLERI